ncbi:MAG: Crp/Fnr family transcriptional regulator [Bacteroidales bacterium]|nr:Crp/Fnr family transcriptional regulator [Bacteroidales bacterium]MBN2748360.1 Crp/Fnr family transcriptional regulator [Bacteroidales bacterium]
MVGDDVTVEQCFKALSREQADLLVNSSTVLVYKKGETIIKQGMLASNVLFLEKGLVKLNVDSDGQTSTIKLVTSNTFIGIMCAFANKTVDFSAVALVDSTVRQFDKSRFEEAIQSNSQFSLLLIKLMSLMTNDMVHDLTRLSRKNVDGAIALFLLELARIFGSNRFELPLSRIEIAEVIGCSKESVTNSLSLFKRDSLIDIDGKNVELLDAGKLQVIARNG